jgi:septal ring factor EnvC (AmiA/AmiB activator)
MFNTITIALFLALIALAAAVVAIGWLSKVRKHLSELGMRVLESQDIGRINEAAKKTESFESRMAGCERKADESQNQLAEHKTKLSELTDKLRASGQKMASFEVRFEELATRLESVEQMANKNEAGLAEVIPSIKALADEIQTLQKFQTATEKVRSLILDAFTDMQASMPLEEGLRTTPETAKPDETSQGLEEWQEKAEDQNTSGSRRWHS